MSNSNLNNFNNYLDKILCTGNRYKFKDKSNNITLHLKTMLNKCVNMFIFENLPDTISQRDLNLMLICGGFVAFTEINGKYYVFNGGLGGEPNVYYMPTIFTLANPALNISKNLKIDEDCIIIPSDSLYMGLLPIIEKYANLLTETELSLYLNLVNTRIIQLICAGDDDTKDSAKLFLQQIQQGDLGVIAENAFLDGVRTLPYSNTINHIKDIIECLQYTKASFLNEIGINANFNMKREALNSAESGLNEHALKLLVDDMLKCRERAIEKINTKYNLNIQVKLNPIWEDARNNEPIWETEVRNNENADEIIEDETVEEMVNNED